MRLVLLSLLLLTGCDQLGDAAMRMVGYQEQTIALASQPFELNSQGRTFTSQEPMSNLGLSSVCVTLRAGYPLGPVEPMDRDYRASLNGAELSAVLVAENGKEYRLNSVGQAWRKYGAVSSKEELAACVSCACDTKIPKGTVIKSVQIKSDRPLSVLGAYWNSTPEIDVPKS